MYGGTWVVFRADYESSIIFVKKISSINNNR
jgi:hypothetical protein